MTANATEKQIRTIAELLPNSSANLDRLAALLSAPAKPKIAVFGKYNHGKSTLLNAVVGYEKFSVSDKRETTHASEFEHAGVIWIDTPGLDADVAGQDDKKAKAAAFESADILCLVHSVEAGELDRSEKDLYLHLVRQDNNYRKKLVLVLTQIDQVNKKDLEQVKEKVRGQLPELQICCVSALRYTRGIRDAQPKFIEASGMPDFLSYLNKLKNGLAELRRSEGRRLVRKARLELSEMISDRKRALASAEHDSQALEEEFLLDLSDARRKVTARAES